MTNQKHWEILLVEDNAGDVRMVQEGLKELLPNARLSVVRDGVQATEFLRHSGNSGNNPRPDLILLDLQTPKKSGFQVLDEIKRDLALHNIPVVVHSSSEAPVDIARAYSLGANCFVTKPTSLDDMYRIVGALVEYWTSVVTLPAEERICKTN